MNGECGRVFLVQQCIVENWSLRIGDPTLVGWLTAAAYFVTALLSYLTLQSARSNERIEYRRFWTLAAVGLAFLGANKQLDLQVLLTAAMRCVAQANGWYAERRQYQEFFIVGVMVGAVFLLLGALLYFRKTIQLIAPAFLGLLLLSTFVVLRAASFHHEEESIGIPLPETNTANALLELPGILLVALNAMQLLLRRRGQAA
jgi:phosphate/sulfate permease